VGSSCWAWPSLEASDRLALLADYLQPDIPTHQRPVLPRFGGAFVNGSNFNAGGTAVAGPLSGWHLTDPA
jgi:hypothetical protein